jgi:hypothetical protein
MNEDTRSGLGSYTHRGKEALREVLLLGARLIGVFPNGAYIAKEEDFLAAFTNGLETVEALMSGAGDPEGRAKGQNIRCFRFCPAEAGLLCLDIDRGHGNPIDGLSEFYDLFERLGKPQQALPSILQDIAGGSFPVYTATPRGGFHLFFRYRGPEVKKCLLAPNVEVFHSHAYLMTTGSQKEDHFYILHGHLADAPKLPPILERRLPNVAGETKKGHSSDSIYPQKRASRRWTNWPLGRNRTNATQGKTNSATPSP